MPIKFTLAWQFFQGFVDFFPKFRHMPIKFTLAWQFFQGFVDFFPKIQTHAHTIHSCMAVFPGFCRFFPPKFRHMPIKFTLAWQFFQGFVLPWAKKKRTIVVMHHVISKNLRSDFTAMHRCVKSRQSEVAFRSRFRS